ncbi:MAG: DUF952 domain-containing protein [Beijerinckiaceae bacterium]|nr:DUF952 domain-containing protein [Beijerinckiaceae bacterium]
MIAAASIGKISAKEPGLSLIYKILPQDLWREASANGVFHGAAIDLLDGYIHFSDASQVRETAARHFAAQDGLMLLAVSAEALGDTLKWEPSRGGALFPHLYGPLDILHVVWAKPLPLDEAGRHLFPDEVAR